MAVALPLVTAHDAAPGDVAQIAVIVVVSTTGHRQDFAGTMDHMAVLRESIVKQSVNENAFKEKRATPPLVCELPMNVSTIAFVMPDVETKWHAVLRHYGWDVRPTQYPVEANEIKKRLTANVVTNDNMYGLSEIAKFYGLILTDFDRVVVLEPESHVHHSIRSIIEAFDVALLDQPHAALGWTRGFPGSRRMDGSFLVFNPSADGPIHYKEILEVFREGEYSDTTGWRFSGAGVTEGGGGATLHGLLPYYFQSHHSSGHFDTEMERCRFNAKAELLECQMSPFDAMVVTSFNSAECWSPFQCQRQEIKLCTEMTDDFWQHWKALQSTQVSRLGIAAPVSTTEKCYEAFSKNVLAALGKQKHKKD